VTGGTGFAGSHLIDQLLEEETAVAAWSHRGGRDAAAGTRPVHWSSVDLLDRDAVAGGIAALRPSFIYHCAGVAHVGDAWTDPARALRVNVIGTHHVLEAVRAAGLECAVLVTGSALVYRPSTSPLSEDDAVGPSDT
jgi:GDP-4-dehydro-6-deoxy-D-mannose reductase